LKRRETGGEAAFEGKREFEGKFSRCYSHSFLDSYLTRHWRENVRGLIIGTILKWKIRIKTKA